MSVGVSKSVARKRDKICSDLQEKILAYKVLHNKKTITDNELQDIILGKIDI